MRAIWSGAISFGLVNIPVKLYSGTDEHGLDFNMLHEEDLSPIKYVRVCRADGEEVPYDEIVKGYEYRKGDYVILTDQDFEKANLKKTKAIDIYDFVPESEIESVYFEKPYYLEPAVGAEKPYALLRQALEKSGKVGIAKYVIRNREHLGAIKPRENLIILEQLRFQGEIRDHQELKLPGEIAEASELKIALALIDQLSSHFDPSQYKDTYVTEVKEIIEEKVKGNEIRPKGEAPRPTEVKNLMEMLKKSLEEAKR